METKFKEDHNKNVVETIGFIQNKHVV